MLPGRPSPLERIEGLDIAGHKRDNTWTCPSYSLILQQICI